MPKRIDVSQLPLVIGTLYPAPFDEPCRKRERKRLGDAAGLTQFGVNLLRLAPGVWSSQRHWHTACDEFVYVLAGEVTLVSDEGEEILRAGECAGFKANDRNGHCLRNQSNADALVLEVGTRDANDGATYSDIDLLVPAGWMQKWGTGGPTMYTKRDGTPYAMTERKG